mgnify:CR=1 FL=1
MPTSELIEHQRLCDLYIDHHGWLQAWLCRRLGCPQRAADLAQNTFLRLITLGHPLAELTRPRAWLTTTAQRLIVDEIRRHRIERAYVDALAVTAADDVFPSAEQVFAAVQTLACLASVLQAVPAKARVAFLRHYLDGVSQSEIAAELGVSVRMVRKYLVRVLFEARGLGIDP